MTNKRGTNEGRRTEAKQRRNKGLGAMKAANMNHAQWSQKHDPLFGVKGKERHRLIRGKCNG